MNQPGRLSRSTRAQRPAAPAEMRFYSIEVVASIVGLGPATIRRYEHLGLVEPDRTATGYRLYTDRDVERLRLFGWRRWLMHRAAARSARFFW